MPKLLRITMLAAAAVLVTPGLTEVAVLATEPFAATATLAADVRTLIAGLGSETRSVRVQAEKRLIELGPPVLPHLPAPELLPSVSVREAVRRIRREVEEVQARDSVLPSRVTRPPGGTLGDVLADITKQTGNRLDGEGLSDDLLRQPVELRFASTPFWQVLADVAEKFKLRYEYDASQRGLKVLAADSNGPEAGAPATCAGAFRIEATAVERIRRMIAVRGGVLERRDLLRVTLNVSAESRLRPLFLQFAASEVAARSQNKAVLPPFTPEATYELALGEGGGPSRIQLEYLIPDGAEVATIGIAGQLHCTTAAGNDQIRFTDVRKLRNVQQPNIARRRGGVTVTLTRIQIAALPAGKNELRIQTAVSYDAGGPAFESHRTWILHNEVFLEDAGGQRLRLNGGSQTAQQGDGGVAIEYRFVDLPDPLPDYAFVYVAPTMIIDVPIEFEIQSLPVKTRP